MKRFIVDVRKNNGELAYLVHDREEKKTQFADTTKSAQMVLDKLTSMVEKGGQVYKPKNNKVEQAKAKYEAERKAAIRTNSGHKCACCGSALSERAADFIRRNGKKVPANNPLYRKWVCPRCQKNNGLSQYLLSK